MVESLHGLHEWKNINYFLLLLLLLLLLPLLPGLSDPFVELSLLPNWLFPDKQAKTATKKQTVDPHFNEELYL